MILLALGCAFACVIAVVRYQRNVGGRRSLSEVATSTFLAADDRRVPAAQLPAPPPTIPSRRLQQYRSLGWGIGFCTVLVRVIALAAGTPQRSEVVQRLQSAGAEFALVRAEEVSHVRRHSSSGKDPYMATVLVELPGDGNRGTASATVRTKTTDELRPGDRVRVLYAPSQPNLGAVAGDERSLGPELRGESLSTARWWILVAVWALAACFAVSVVSTRHGFRAFSRLSKGDKAVRGQCNGVGRFRYDGTGAQADTSKGKYLEIGTESGPVHFFMDISRGQLPEKAQGQSLWLCWDTRRGTRGGRFSAGTTPAALMFDTGLVVHGMLNVDQGKSLAEAAVSMEELRVTEPSRQPLRLWEPRAEWPLFVDPMMLSLYVAIITCAALLTFDVETGWRWAVGIVAVLAVLAAGGLQFEDGDQPSARPEELHRL
jgi:hypothetical protein